MSIELACDVVQSLSGIAWLSRRGQPEAGCVCVIELSDAIYYIDRDEVLYLGMADVLRERWRSVRPDLPEWNGVVRSVRPCVDQLLDKELPPHYSRREMPSVWGRFRTIVMMAAIERGFGLATGPTLFQRGVDLVRRGRLPVGWEGDFSTGCFVVL